MIKGQKVLRSHAYFSHPDYCSLRQNPKQTKTTNYKQIRNWNCSNMFIHAIVISLGLEFVFSIHLIFPFIFLDTFFVLV